MEVEPHTRLAGECLQPLGHLSRAGRLKCRGGPWCGAIRRTVPAFVSLQPRLRSNCVPTTLARPLACSAVRMWLGLLYLAPRETDRCGDDGGAAARVGGGTRPPAAIGVPLDLVPQIAGILREAAQTAPVLVPRGGDEVVVIVPGGPKTAFGVPLGALSVFLAVLAEGTDALPQTRCPSCSAELPAGIDAFLCGHTVDIRCPHIWPTHRARPADLRRGRRPGRGHRRPNAGRAAPCRRTARGRGRGSVPDVRRASGAGCALARADRGRGLIDDRPEHVARSAELDAPRRSASGRHG